MAITNFGKSLKKILIDKESSLKELSSKLGVTSAYISAVISGKKDIPDKWLNEIADIYNLNDEEMLSLSISFVKTKKEITIPADDLSDKQIECLLEFEKLIGEFSDNDDINDLNEFIFQIGLYRNKLEIKKVEVYRNANKGSF